MNTDFCSICSEEFIKKTSTQMTCPNKECRKDHQEASKNTKKIHGHLVLVKESIKTGKKEEKQSGGDSARKRIIQCVYGSI